MALDPITGAEEFATALVEKLIPDPAAKAQAMLQLEQMKQSGDLAQIAADQQEASNENLFVAGWRPFIGWVCGVAYTYHFILQPLITYVLAIMGKTVVLPVFDMNELSSVLMGMLGLGVLRTAEKMGNDGNLPWQRTN